MPFYGETPETVVVRIEGGRYEDTQMVNFWQFDRSIERFASIVFIILNSPASAIFYHQGSLTRANYFSVKTFFNSLLT